MKPEVVVGTVRCSPNEYYMMLCITESNRYILCFSLDKQNLIGEAEIIAAAIGAKVRVDE